MHCKTRGIHTWLVRGTSAFVGCDFRTGHPQLLFTHSSCRTAPLNTRTFHCGKSCCPTEWFCLCSMTWLCPLSPCVPQPKKCPSAVPVLLWEDRDQDVPHSCPQGSTEEMTQPLLSSCIPEVCSSALSQFSVLEKPPCRKPHSF